MFKVTEPTGGGRARTRTGIWSPTQVPFDIWTWSVFTVPSFFIILKDVNLKS